MKIIQILFQCVLLFSLPQCKKAMASPAAEVNPNAVDTTTPTVPVTFFAKGADVSWITEMESNNLKFYNSAGAEKEGMQLLKDLGMNSIRLRVWVNPSDNWCNTSDLLVKALRAKSHGMKIMIDFHYSDIWADPGHQTKPAAWSALDFAGLKNAVRQHTLDVMNVLKSNGIAVTWVQVGNETNDGMLWPEGKASTNMANFAELINAGYDAVKTVSPESKVIVHVSNGYDNGLFRWMFDGLKVNGARWDIIGMSMYPTASDWATKNIQCQFNMNDMITRYNKEVMITEVGMSWDNAATSKAFIADLIAKTKSLPGSKGLGVFYWEPEGYNNWKGYTLGAFDNAGKPTQALDAFR